MIFAEKTTIFFNFSAIINPIMSFISTTNAHFRTFFTASIQSDGPPSLRTIADLAATTCFYPLRLLGGIIWEDTSNFVAQGRRIIPLENPPFSSISFRVCAFAMICFTSGRAIGVFIRLGTAFFIGQLVIGASIRAVLLVVSPIFRHQYQSVVSHFLSKQPIFTVTSVDPFKDPLRGLAEYLSFKEIAFLSETNKLWYNRTKVIFLEKQAVFLKKHPINSDQNPFLEDLNTMKSVFDSVRLYCPTCVVNALGVEQVLNLSIVEKNPRTCIIARTSDFRRIEILTVSQDAQRKLSQKEILIIRCNDRFPTQKIAVYWGERDTKCCVRPFKSLLLTSIPDLINGKEVKVTTPHNGVLFLSKDTA